MLAVEVQAGGEPVDLERDVVLARDLDHALEVERVLRSAADDPAQRMAQAAHGGMAQRLLDAPRQLGARHPLAAVHAGLDPVEPGEDVVLEIEPAVGQDVAFDAAQDAERRETLVRGGDLVALAAHVVGGEEIAAANEALAPFRILRGIECDILPDGRLDLPDDVLAGLDWVQASVHGGKRMPRREMTARVEEALRNPSVRCLSHPKGRIIHRRPENALDLDRIYEVALEQGVAVEVNGLPDRLDLHGEHVRDALRAGVSIVCSTDAHSTRGLGNMELSVRTARRGWAGPADVLNTRPPGSLLRSA